MRRLFKQPWVIVGIVAAVTVFFGLQLPKVELDNNTFRFIPEDNPAKVAMEKMDDQYGSTMSILVGFRSTYGTILDRDFLLKIQELGTRAEELPNVDSVTSIMNIDLITGTDEGIEVVPMVPEGFEGTRDQLDALRKNLLSWDMYRRAIVSDDLRSTQVLVNLAGATKDGGSAESVRLYQDIKGLVDEIGFAGYEVYTTGMPAYTSVMNSAMRSDLVVLIPMVVIAVLGILFLSFRKIGGIVLPILTVLVAVIWTVGLMAMLGIKLSLLATVMPVILVACGSAYGIHVVSHYYDELAGLSFVSKERHTEIIFHVLKRVNRPVFLAALTTFAGFVSLAFTPVVPIREFGTFASIGVMVAWVASIFLIPALLLIRGPKKTAFGKMADGEATGASEGPVPEFVPDESDAHLEADPISRSIANGFSAVAKRPTAVLAFGVVVLALGIFGASRLIIDNVVIEYFKEDTDIVKSDRYIGKEFAGAKTLAVIIRGQEKGDLTDPVALKAMDDLGAWLEKEMPAEVGKVTGFQHLIKRINQVFNAGESPEGLAVAATPSAGEAGGDEGWSADAWGDDGAVDDAASEDDGFGDFGSWDEGAENPDPADEAAVYADTDTITRSDAVDLLAKALANAQTRGVSIETVMDELKKEVNYEGSAYYEIPTDLDKYGKTDPEQLKNLVGNYLVLLSGDIDSWANDPLQPSEARMTVQLRATGNIGAAKVKSAIERYVADRFPEGYTVEISGTAVVEQALNELVVSSQLTSIIISLLGVFVILSIYYRSPWAGVLGIITLGVAILVNFAIMGFMGLRLNVGTALIASISIGTGIDYIIHYLAAWHHETLNGHHKERVIRRTFLTSGKAILFNAVSVAAGFIVLAFSQFNMLMVLGVLISVSMLVASLISLTILPAMISLFKPTFLERALPFERNTTEGAHA